MTVYSILTTVLIGLVVLYGMFLSRSILGAPVFKNVEALKQENLLFITGNIKRVNFVAINDKQIFLNKEGDFRHSIVLNDGFNIIKLVSRNKSGKQTIKEIQVIK